MTKKTNNELGYLFTQTAFLRQRIVNSALNELDITHVQFAILSIIIELENTGTIVTQQAVSDARRLDKAMVSNVVKTLINKGLIIRGRHPADKRAFTLSATKDGAAKSAKGIKIVRQADKSFFSEIDNSVLHGILSTLLINNN